MSPAGRATVGMTLVALIGLSGLVGLVVLVGRPEDLPAGPDAPLPADQGKSVIPELPSPTPATPPAGPRRMKVAGQEGYFVVVELDGTTLLEAPDGTRTMLVEAGPTLVLPKTAPPVVLPGERRPVGQLVVCDTGVVDVPVGAVITYIGRDTVVTRDDDGATVYHTDGRVERRGRPARETPVKPSPKD